MGVLKPCPFCGSEADIHFVDVTISSDLRFKYEYQPGCETDKCPGEWGGPSYCSADEAYEKWNTRATNPHICSLCGNDERVAKLEKMLGLRPDVAFMKLNRANMLLKEMEEALYRASKVGIFSTKNQQWIDAMVQKYHEQGPPMPMQSVDISVCCGINT